MMNKEEKYQLLTEQIRALTEGETDLVAKMANVTAAIHEEMGFFWTGFYRGGRRTDSGAVPRSGSLYAYSLWAWCVWLCLEAAHNTCCP